MPHYTWKRAGPELECAQHIRTHTEPSLQTPSMISPVRGASNRSSLHVLDRFPRTGESLFFEERLKTIALKRANAIENQNISRAGTGQ
jgi:hypothetical protein